MPAHAEGWESRVAHFWATVDLADAASAIAAMQELAAERGHGNPDARFELGGIFDATGDEEEAAAHYAAARDLGLARARLAQLNIQQGSTLRNLGRVEEAISMLESTDPDPSIGDAKAVFLALALRDAGRYDEALRTCIDALVPHLPRYQRSAAAYARALTESSGQ